MDTTSAISNNSWKFHDYMTMGTLSKMCDGQTDRQTEQQTDWQTDGRKNRRIDPFIELLVAAKYTDLIGSRSLAWLKYAMLLV